MSSSFSIGDRVVRPDVVDGYAHNRDGRHVFNGAPGAAVSHTVVFPASLRNGSMTAVFSALADALELDSMLSGIQPIVFSDSDTPSLAMTFLLNGRSNVAQSAARGAWLVTFDFQEVVL